ncbi:MAG: phosphate acetyltransferase [Ruminococcus sp.]|nr:phosphate acetyltransferase [Ruminococcus sp.]
MGMFDKLIANLKESKKTIVFTEGNDKRILSAADRLLKEGLMGVILCGNADEVADAANKNGFSIDGAEIIDPETYPEFEALVSQMVELRKGKMTEDECRTLLKKSNYFGTMLVKAGKADALLGGATYSTADTVRPALQIIKTKKGSNLVSSSFILFREKDGQEEKIAMGDCAINLGYTDRVDKDGNVTLSAARQLAEVAVETARTADFFGIDPKVAVLSFSTYGSGKGGTVQLSHDAVIEARNIDPNLVIDGEFQFDAAVSEEVAKTKCPDSEVAGKANTFIFPLIEAGNIGYKIAQRLGGFEAYGPILQGLNAPINDLSRGCTADEVYKMAIITAGMA